MTKRKTPWLSLLKDYWWLAGVGIACAATITAYVGLPKRVETVEAGQAKQAEKVGELKEWAARTQGYIDGQQQVIANQQRLNDRLATQQQTPNAPLAPVSTHELSDDGEVKEMRWTDEDGKKWHMCCTGSDCWPWDRKRKCVP